MSTPFLLLDTPLPPGVTLLQASAGTGKTYTLAALVLRLIAEEGIPIGRIVVTTYTIPATAELRSRVRELLAEVLDDLPREKPTPFVAEFVRHNAGNPDFTPRLAAALRDFDQASISTIHGFCHRMISERTFESGTRPSLELVPDESALVQETAEDFWRLHFSNTAPGLTPIAMLKGLTPDNLARLYANASNHQQAIVRPDAADAERTGAEVLAMLTELRAQWPTWREALLRIFITDADWAIGDWGKVEVMQPQFELIERLATDEHAPLSAYQALDYFRPSVIHKSGVSKKKPLPSHPFMDWCEKLDAACDAFAATTRASFLKWARADLASRKDRLGLIAFGDLLSIFHAALHRPGSEHLVSAIQARFDVALVDEFQDTDPIQAGIFQRLFGEKPQRLFFIGDPKQAIYGFRGADLFTYLRVTGKADRKFRLDTNHRSDALLVESVNTLFRRTATPFIDGEIKFESVLAARKPEERPLTVNGSPRSPMRFWFWESEKATTSGKANADLPQVVASEIVRMLKSSRLGERALLPRDCAILCVKNAQCQEMQAALGERGVPSVVLTNASVFGSDEAREFHLIVTALASPSREACIRAALATRILGYDAAALERVSTESHEWEAILARFHGYHLRWREGGFIQMFRELIQAEHLRTRMLAQPQGERVLTNLLHLAELLHSTAQELQLGPSGLLRWFAEQVQNPGSGEERELRLESDDDAVKILTIHKSKGLEWPVVFCPFLWSKADLHKNHDPLFHDADFQAILDLGSPDRAHAVTRAEHEQLSERLRLLYVALTRAKHECHVVWGKFRDSENSALMWLLEPPADPGDDAPAALRTHAESLTSDMLQRTITSIAAESPEHFATGGIPEIADALYAPTASASAIGDARVFHGAIDRSWRVSSFTAFTAARNSEEADHDHDVRPAATGERRGIHAFPCGMKAGVCLHDILENLDFTRPSSIHALVESKLRLHGMHTLEHALAVVQTVRKLVDVPLLLAPPAPPAKKSRKKEEATLELPMPGDGLRLSAIPTSRTLREWEFHLPSGLITQQELSAFVEAGLTFEPRRGILKGFMDLVFEHDGRFHILDWKSNSLGTSSDNYSAEAMRAEIVHHRYDLQWQIYLLALHRYLRMRLGKNYDPARNLGTVFYVFLRGVEIYQPTLGIYRAEPDLAAINRLDALFSNP